MKEPPRCSQSGKTGRVKRLTAHAGRVAVCAPSSPSPPQQHTYLKQHLPDHVIASTFAGCQASVDTVRFSAHARRRWAWPECNSAVTLTTNQLSKPEAAQPIKTGMYTNSSLCQHTEHAAHSQIQTQAACDMPLHRSRSASGTECDSAPPAPATYPRARL